jgi:predicted SAM-dependent methyltransferase
VSWWWAGCLQRGIRHLQEQSTKALDVVLIANDDTSFPPDHVERAMQFLNANQGCMLLARTRNAATGAIEESGVCADLRTMTFREAIEQSDINCLPTRGLFLRWGDMKNVGGFHPVVLPHYWSDYEYTMRAIRKGLKGVTSETVWLRADLNLSGNRDLGALFGWRLVRELLSTKYLLNPMYKSSFVILACPPRWIASNLLRIWWQAFNQVVRQGLLRSLPNSLLATGRAAWNHVRRFARSVRLKRQIKASHRTRIVLGSGETAIPGWILTDIDQLNVLKDGDWRRYFAPNSIDSMLAEHVWEHMSEQDGIDAARLCFKYLRPGGRLRIAVPDGFHPDPRYVDAVKPGGSGPGADDHKVLYSCRSLQVALSAAGFQPFPLEYFDEDRRFHAVDWDADDGMIQRSARFDDRNRDGEMRYTSIIVDCLKPRP